MSTAVIDRLSNVFEESPPSQTTVHDDVLCPHHSAADCVSEGGEVATCAPGQRLMLSDVLARFRREVVTGTCDTGRYRTRYFSWGEGPPIVFIHGMGDDAETFVMPCALLSKQFRCITYNLPQGNDDGARLARYRHADLVADLHAIIDHLGVKQTFLFGSSFGSTIALAAMHGDPSMRRFPRGILQGGFARRPLAVAEIMLADWARYWPSTMDHLPLRLAVLRQTHFAPFAGREPAVWQYFLDRDGSNPIQAVARRAIMISQIDLRRQLPAIRQPVLIVCGDHDPLVDKRCEQDLLDGLPNVARAELAGCGHMPEFTHPEALAEIVRRFLV